MDYVDQVDAVEHALCAAIAANLADPGSRSESGSGSASAAPPFPVTVWGDNSGDLKDHPVAVYVHGEAETPAVLGRQIVRAGVTVRSAATVDLDRAALEAACAAVERATPKDLDLQSGAAVAPQGWGALELSADQFLTRTFTVRVFVHF